MTNKSPVIEREPSQILGELPREKQRIVEVLRINDVPMTYERVAAQLGYSILQYRSVSTMIKGLRKSKIVVDAGKFITITGTRADGFILRKPFDTARFPWQDALFALGDYRQTSKERVLQLVRNIGKKNADPHEVAESIADILIGMQMPNDMRFVIDEVTSKPLYVRGSETSEEAAERAKYFSAPSRVRAYTAIMQGYRAKGRGITRNEGIAISGMWPSSFLPRVTELIEGKYIILGDGLRNPSTGKKHQTLVPTGKARLQTTTTSSFYNDRLQVMGWIDSLLTTNKISGKYYGDPELIFNSASKWADKFILKHATQITREDLHIAENEYDDPGKGEGLNT